jgi:hypothetical protein
MSQSTIRTTVTILCTALSALVVLIPATAYSQTNPPTDERVIQGLAIAPVSLNLTGRDRDMVGLGSYLVNAVGGCNDCHTDPSYTPDGDPFMGKAKKVNTAGYLAGGQAFGPFLSRNITPDYTGRAVGGNTFDDFLKTMRTGVDPKNIHPAISPLLQVMPWPTYQDMKDQDLRAIYEYLSAIPCVEGGPGTSSNRCGPRPPVPTISITPRIMTTASMMVTFDASGSKASNGGPLRYVWENFLGGPYATISDPNSPTPKVSFVNGPGVYSLMLSVIDQSGLVASMAVKITYTGS